MEEKDLELIESYLDDELNVEDRKSFEARLDEESLLFRNFKAVKLIREGLQGIEMQEFQAEVEQWEAELQEEKGQKRIRMIPLWASRLTVAVVVLLIMAVGLNRFATTRYSNEGLIAQHYVPFESQARNSSNDLQSLQAGLGIDLSVCDLSIAALDTISSIDESYSLAQILLGHCFMKSKEYTKAANSFQSAFQHPNMKAEEAVDIYWNFLLANIGMGKTLEEMEALFQGVPPSATQKFIEVDIEGLRKDLTSFWRKWAD